MKRILLPAFCLGILHAGAQLTIQSGATFMVSSGAVVTVQGNVTSSATIQGTGKLLMKGSSNQNLNMNGNSIQTTLEVDNTSHVTLGGDAVLSGALTFTNGKLILGDNDITLTNTASHSGATTTKYAQTNGEGIFKKQITANGTTVLPIGDASYNPLSITTAGATYSSAVVGAIATGDEHPNKHPRSTDFLESYWKISRSGISGGTTTAVGTYQTADVTGVEADIRTLVWNGSTWIAGSSQNNASNTVTANVTAANQDLYAMNRFVLVSPKALLQGPLNGGLMDDKLRSTDVTQNVGVASTNNIIPTSDPYRTADYISQFAHVNNTIPETIANSVLYHKAAPADNIVDWVFVQLRTSTGPNNAAVTQTRSALLQRDGDIVDIDGVSPVYFKNVDPLATYVIAVRHRNHLSISSNPATALSLGLATTSFDFTNTGNTAAIYGTAGQAYIQIGGKNVIWAGNVTGNGYTRYLGANGPGSANASDRDALLINIGGVPSQVLSNQYTKGDLNMNRVTRLIGNNGPGAANLGDGNFLLNVLNSSQTEVRTQVLPAN